MDLAWSHGPVVWHWASHSLLCHCLLNTDQTVSKFSCILYPPCSFKKHHLDDSACFINLFWLLMEQPRGTFRELILLICKPARRHDWNGSFSGKLVFILGPLLFVCSYLWLENPSGHLPTSSLSLSLRCASIKTKCFSWGQGWPGGRVTCADLLEGLWFNAPWVPSWNNNFWTGGQFGNSLYELQSQPCLENPF